MSTFEILQDDYDDNNARVTVVLGGVHPYYMDIWEEATYENKPVGRYQGNILVDLADPTVAKQIIAAYTKAAQMLSGKEQTLKTVHQARIDTLEVQGPDDGPKAKYLRIKWSTGLDYPVTIINAMGKPDNSEASKNALRQAVMAGAIVGCKLVFQAVMVAGKLKVFANLVGVQHQGDGPVLSSSGGPSPEQQAQGFGATQNAGLAGAGDGPGTASADASPADSLGLDIDLDDDIPF